MHDDFEQLLEEGSSLGLFPPSKSVVKATVAGELMINDVEQHSDVNRRGKVISLEEGKNEAYSNNDR